MESDILAESFVTNKWFTKLAKRSQKPVDYPNLNNLPGFELRKTKEKKKKNISIQKRFSPRKLKKRSFSDIAQDDLKHLKGFGFSKFGKRSVFEELKGHKEKMKNHACFNQKHLKGFGFSSFGKRSELRKIHQKKEDLKYLSGFGFSKLGKRNNRPAMCTCRSIERTNANKEYQTKGGLQN